MPRPADIPDVNVWPATSMRHHSHQGRTTARWRVQPEPQVGFCGVTSPPPAPAPGTRPLTFNPDFRRFAGLELLLLDPGNTPP
jgi:hypothetical protein